MGFNKKERERAKQEQWAAQERTKRLAAEEEAYAKGERARSEALMAPIEALGKRAIGRVEAFDTGKDISQVYPALAGMMGQASDQYKSLTRQAGPLDKDPRYLARLQRSQKGQFMSNLGRAITESAYSQRGADVGEASNALGMGLSAGQQRLGTFGQSMGSAGQVFGQASNLREAALAQAQASFGNLMSGISAATGMVSGGAGAYKAIKDARRPSSDIRLKTFIHNSPYGLDEIKALESVKYIIDGEWQIGLIAQQVETVMPEFVKEREDGMKTVDYALLTSVLIKAVQELSEELKEHKKKKSSARTFLKKIISWIGKKL